MNTLDILIIVIVLLLAYYGFRRGFLVSVFSLISIVVGLVLATKFHSGFALVLHKFIKDDKALNIISFLIIYFLIYFAGIFIASKISKLSSITRSVDKILGLLLGVLKGLLVASLILILLKTVGAMSENTFRESNLYPYVSRFAPDTFDAISKILPFNKKSFDDLNSFIHN